MAEPGVSVVGSVNIDVVYQVASIPLAGETVIAVDSAELDGGKGGNQAVAAARLGAHVAMIACVGTDAAGDRALSALIRAGIDVRTVTRRGPHTGAADRAGRGRRGELDCRLAGCERVTGGR